MQLVGPPSMTLRLLSAALEGKKPPAHGRHCRVPEAFLLFVVTVFRERRTAFFLAGETGLLATVGVEAVRSTVINRNSYLRRG
jgi:hypothetical protein